MELLRAEEVPFSIAGGSVTSDSSPGLTPVVGFRYSTVRQSRHRFCIPSVAALFVEAGNFYDLIWKNCQLVAAMALGMLRESTPKQLTCKPESRHPNSFR